jgi:enoyl-[acyl-carrier-protein] reductase (NADH)
LWTEGQITDRWMKQRTWVAAVVDAANMRLMPQARAVLPCSKKCCLAMDTATREDEQAVSTLSEGPVSTMSVKPIGYTRSYLTHRI